MRWRPVQDTGGGGGRGRRGRRFFFVPALAYRLPRRRPGPRSFGSVRAGKAQSKAGQAPASCHLGPGLRRGEREKKMRDSRQTPASNRGRAGSLLAACRASQAPTMSGISPRTKTGSGRRHATVGVRIRRRLVRRRCVDEKSARREGGEPRRDVLAGPAGAARVHHHHRSLHGLLRERPELSRRSGRPGRGGAEEGRGRRRQNLRRQGQSVAGFGAFRGPGFDARDDGYRAESGA